MSDSRVALARMCAADRDRDLHESLQIHIGGSHGRTRVHFITVPALHSMLWQGSSSRPDSFQVQHLLARHKGEGRLPSTSLQEIGNEKKTRTRRATPKKARNAMQEHPVSRP